MQTLIQVKDPSGQDVDVHAFKNGMLWTVPYQVVWTAKGYGYQAMATAAVAALVVRPTTVAMATLYNNNAAGGKHLVIERAFAHNLVAVANSNFGLWLCVHPEGMTKPTNDITVRNSLNGKAAGGSNTIFDNGATVVDDGWFLWGDAGTTITVTTPGGHLNAEVGGRIHIPPTAALSIQVVAITTSATFCPGFHYYEVPASELGV
jgi:hypothetical protein